MLCSIYSNVGNGIADIYVYFFAQAIKLTKTNGIVLFITLNKWLKTKYGKELRRTFANDVSVDLIIDFFELPVFNNASTDAAITKIINAKTNIETRYFPIKTLENLDLVEITKGYYQKTIKNDSEWQFVNEEQEKILSKIIKDSISLGDFVSWKIFSGIKTGLNKAFIIKDKQIAEKLLKSESASLLKHYAHSTDIQQWSLKENDNYFLATGYDIDIKNEYPTAFTYINQFKSELQKRGDKGKNWYNLRPCAYYSDFDKTKLIYIHTAKNHQFFLDFEGHYINNSCYMIVTKSKFLFCFLNSKLFQYFKKLKFVAYGDGQEDGRCKLDYNKMITVPIKKHVNEKPFEEIVEYIYKAKKVGKDTKKEEQKIERMIYDIYNLSPKEINIVEENL